MIKKLLVGVSLFSVLLMSSSLEAYQYCRREGCDGERRYDGRGCYEGGDRRERRRDGGGRHERRRDGSCRRCYSVDSANFALVAENNQLNVCFPFLKRGRRGR